MTNAPPAADLLTRVHRLTGFDPMTVSGAGSDVAVFGIGGTGVTSLVQAMRATDPGIVVREGRWDRRPGDATIGVALMVVDPSSSVGDEERDAVDELRSRFGVVGLVCSKIDAYWEWPRVLRAHRELLDPHEDLPVFAVSSVVAQSGATGESGVPDLTSWVADQLGAPTDVRRERARVAAALGAVARAEAELVRSADRDLRADTEDLARRRRVLLESRDRGRADRLAAARSGLARVRGESFAEVAAEIRALSAEATARTAALTGRSKDDHVRWLTRSATALRERVDADTDDRIDEVRSATLLGIDGAPPENAGEVGDRGAEPPFGREVPAPRRGGEDLLLVLIGASTGLGVGRLVVAPMASVQTLQWVSMPLTLVLGVVVAALVIRVRRTSALRADMRAWSTDALVETRGRLEHRVGLRIAAAEPHLTSQIVRHYERRARQVAAEVAELEDRQRLVRSGAAEQAERERIGQVRDARRALAEFAGNRFAT